MPRKTVFTNNNKLVSKLVTKVKAFILSEPFKDTFESSLRVTYLIIVKSPGNLQDGSEPYRKGEIIK